MKRELAALISSVFLIAGPSAASQIIFDNGPPGETYAGLIDQFVLADDFVLPETTTLRGLRFWTAELGPWDGTLQYFLFEDIDGGPAEAPFVTGTGQDIVKTSTGRRNAEQFNEFEYVADLEDPLILTGGTRFWLGLHLQSDFRDFCLAPGPDPCRIGWVSIFSLGRPEPAFGLRSFAAYRGAFDDWMNFEGDEHAFQLIGVAEPSSLLLLAAGVVVLAASRQLRNRW